ncbi:hypothetical protein MHF_0967 [Mycoplasma haemofelis Ohio2]|uniref:Uncharacterized protein n=1 Tax=Mycoplasma haemofelis (strain Ohio2) TaxID=859194 RepID=F6FJ24_MYCHI|nr:hypothetical protein MHF_0967 [Mycoplasma haemofelis Ohio2]
MPNLISLVRPNRKLLTLTGCYGVSCGGVYLVLSQVLNKGEQSEVQNLITLTKEAVTEINEQQDEPQKDTSPDVVEPVSAPVPVEKSKREGVIDTVNNQYLTSENAKRQGSKYHFEKEYYRLPQLGNDQEWDQLLKKFQEDSESQSITTVEEVKKYCLDELKWTDSTINLDKLQGEGFPTREYLCIWNHFKHRQEE